MSLPVILYKNLFATGTLSATDTAVGYDINNLVDWRPFTFWQAASLGTKYITIDTVLGGTADTLGIMAHNGYTASALISVESSPDNASWTERLAPFTPASDRAQLKVFTSASTRYWRAKIVTAALAPIAAIIAIGERLTLPRNIKSNTIPWTAGVLLDAPVTKTGNPLTSAFKYSPIDLPIQIPPTAGNYTWYSGAFRDFWFDHFRRRLPFFYAPNLSVFPTDIFFAWMKDGAQYGAPMIFNDRVESITLPCQSVYEEV